MKYIIGGIVGFIVAAVLSTVIIFIKNHKRFQNLQFNFDFSELDKYGNYKEKEMNNEDN